MEGEDRPPTPLRLPHLRLWLLARLSDTPMDDTGANVADVGTASAEVPKRKHTHDNCDANEAANPLRVRVDFNTVSRSGSRPSG